MTQRGEGTGPPGALEAGSGTAAGPLRSLRAVPWAEYAWAAAGAALAVLLLALRTDLKTRGTALFADPGWDRHLYLEMARRDLLDFRLAPYCWRVLVPWTAKLLPFSLQASFLTITVVALVAAGVATFVLVRAAGFSRVHGALAMLLFFSLGWGPKFVLSDFWVPDATVFVFVTIAIVLAAKDRAVWLCVVLAAGVLAKESVIFAAPLLYTLHARGFIDWRRLARTALVAAPAIVLLVALRLLIPEANGDLGHIATMPPEISRFPELFSEYSYSQRFDEIGREYRWGDRAWGDLDRYFSDPFGVLLLTLAVLGCVRRPGLALRLAPFLLLVYFQLLFATDTQRLIVLAFPAVAWLAMHGAELLHGRLRLHPAALLPLAALLFAITLRDPARYDTPVLPLALLVGSYLVAAVAVALVSKRANGRPRPNPVPPPAG